VAEIRGIIISCLYRNKITFFEYNPMQIKLAVTGYGKADKTAVTKMVRLQLGRFFDDSSKKIKDDTMDALALGLTHSTSRRLK
ncbi:MAG TPA: crossover junction endodeoxyribonuclease RuvC, partial [Allocoleopsis sp.]